LADVGVAGVAGVAGARAGGWGSLVRAVRVSGSCEVCGDLRTICSKESTGGAAAADDFEAGAGAGAGRVAGSTTSESGLSGAAD